MRNTKTSLKIYSPVIKSDKYAFNPSIENVELSYTVNSIKNSSFFNCSDLKNVGFPRKLSEIGSYAFSNCSSLKTVSMPESIKFLGKGIFKGCTALEEITLPKSITELPSEFFENCRELKSITLPEGLEAIGEECFSGCINLKEITLPESLQYIEDKAFKRCSSLRSIVFPKRLKHIGDKAFDGCTSLTNVIFSSTLEYIGRAAFPEHPLTPPLINGTMFSTSFLPKSNYNLYPTIKIPNGVKKHYLGFENSLNYKQRTENKTCYRHILFLEKYNAKILISENFYSFDKNDAIINNSVFDFKKYDSEFEKADEKEKPIISAFRLTYPIELNNKTEVKYKKHLSDSTEIAALFAIEKNEEDVLKYITANFELTTEYCTFLYEKATQKGYYNLLRILSQIKSKNGFNEIDLLYEKLSG